jgi:putative hemolysin
VRPLLACFVGLGPVRRFIARGLVAPLTRVVRADHRGSGAISVEELSELLEVSAREGDLESGEEQLLGDVVELGSIRVREIMTPRVEVQFLDVSASANEAAEAVSKSGRTEIPVLSGPEGDVVGILDAHRFLAARAIAAVSSGLRPEPRPEDFLDPALFVPELSRLDQLLDEFRRAGRGIAVCVDEHGTIVGLVEVSDVVRRLVGKGDEDGSAEHPAIERIGPGRWVVPGSLRLGDLAGLLDDETAGEATPRAVATVAGLVLHRLGRVPRVDDRLRIRNLELEVQAMRGRRIERVLMSVVDGTSAAPGAEAIP